MEVILVPLGSFAAIVLILWVYFTNRNKERLALIEKGSKATLFNRERKFSAFKWGIFFIGIGVGILIGNVLAVSTTLEEPVAYFSMIFLFGGLSLIANHLMEKKKTESLDE